MLVKLQLIALACTLLLASLPQSPPVRAQRDEAPLPADAAEALERFKNHDPFVLSAFEKVLKTHAHDADALYRIGMVYLREKVHYSIIYKALAGATALRPLAFPEAHAALAPMMLNEDSLANASLHARVALDKGAGSAETVYVLGEAAYRQGNPAEGLRHADDALKLDKTYAPAVLLRSQSLARVGRLGEAAAELERFLAMSPDDPDAEGWQEQLKTFRFLLTQTTATAKPLTAEELYDAQPGVLTESQTDFKAGIQWQPHPVYPKEAHPYGTSGVILMRVTLMPDGRVTNPLVERTLSRGLTREAVRAALKLRFTPAKKGEREVPQVHRLYYPIIII